jgi:hypothetical protein
VSGERLCASVGRPKANIIVANGSRIATSSLYIVSINLQVSMLPHPSHQPHAPISASVLPISCTRSFFPSPSPGARLIPFTTIAYKVKCDLLARPLGVFFFSCFSTLGHCTVSASSCSDPGPPIPHATLHCLGFRQTSHPLQSPILLILSTHVHLQTHLLLDLTGTSEGSVDFSHDG